MHSMSALSTLRLTVLQLWTEMVSPWRAYPGLSQEMAGADMANGIVREQFRQMIRKSKGYLVASVLGLLPWSLVLVNQGAGWQGALWIVAVSACLARTAHLTLSFLRRAPGDTELRPWEARLGRTICASMLAWASCVLVHPMNEEAFIPYVAIGLLMVMAGNMGLFAIYRPSTTWFSLPLGVVICTTFVLRYEGFMQFIGVGLLFTAILLTFMARHQNALLFQTMLNAAQRLALLNEIERLREVAVRAHQAKTRAFASVAHDLRQPMHSISLLTSPLAKHISPEVDARRHIDASVGAMACLLAALKASVDTASDIHTPQAGGVALAEVLNNLEQQLAPQARARKISYRVLACDAWVCTEPFQLQRILRNLVSNAIQCTHEGCVTVRAKVRANRAIVQVWDSGPGISRAHRQRIFDEFYQIPQADRASQISTGLSPTILPTSGSLGLGLATVKHLAHRLGHPVRVRSRVGQCTLFAVELSLHSPSDQQDQHV